MKIVVLILSMLCTTVQATERVYWTGVGLHILDWANTVEITKNKKMWETAILLGKYPTENQVHVYMGSTLVLGFMVHNVLPTKYRDAFDYWYMFTELNYGVTNYNLGIRIPL